MNSNRIRIFLGINYHTVPGENVIVVGNIPELGAWNASVGFALTYHQGGNWSGCLELDRKPKPIQYKYVIYNHTTGEVRWEEGENRMLDLKLIPHSKDEIFNTESWNQREVHIRVKYDCSSKKIMAICGEGIALGNWKNPIRMILVSKKDPVGGTRVPFWERRFFVRHDVKKIKYRFVLLDDEEDTITWEREPDRVCDFVSLTTLSPYKRYESNPNKKDCLKFARKHNRFVKFDCNFVSEFFFNHINDNITIGPYPQNRTEIECLKNLGIRAVLNLQTRSDMKYRSLDWEELKQFYRENNVKVVNFTIMDMSAEDIRFKAYDGANILNELVEKYERVYVHCTAGIWRAPHIVAAYLNLHKGYTIDDAIKLIKEMRPVVYLSKELLQRAFHKYEKRKNATRKNELNGKNVAHEAVSSGIAKIEREENVGYPLGSSLREVRCASGRNL